MTSPGPRRSSGLYDLLISVRSGGRSELAIAGASDESVPFGLSEDECRAVRLPRVPHRDVARRKKRNLDAVPPGRAAPGALQPGGAGQARGRDAITCTAHANSSMSSPSSRMNSLVRSGVALVALTLSNAAVSRSRSDRLSRYMALVSCST